MIDEKKLIEEIESYRGDIFADEIIEIIKHQPKAEWIPCSERLPEENGCYLVAWKTIPMIDRTQSHFYEIVEFDPDDEALWISSIEQAKGLEYEIIAWRPLPEPYREE